MVMRVGGGVGGSFSAISSKDFGRSECRSHWAALVACSGFTLDVRLAGLSGMNGKMIRNGSMAIKETSDTHHQSRTAPKMYSTSRPPLQNSVIASPRMPWYWGEAMSMMYPGAVAMAAPAAEPLRRREM